MVRPLYPPRKKAPPPPPPLWKNPQLVGATAIILILVVVFVYHFYSSRIINPQALPGGEKSESMFSFLEPSQYFKANSKIADLQKEKLKKMGINESSKALNSEVEAKDLREQRRILAIRKYEAARETAERRRREREELVKRLNSKTSQELKRAVVALEASDNLGIMKLESLLEEKLMESGAKSQDLDAIIYAYNSLAKVYEKKRMHDKAKNAYVSAFRLMKRRAPADQEPEWNAAIDEVEQMQTPATSGSN
ncbi:MAG: hypothetical protein ACQETH_04510 [Candidatus Rifleibacteriota bacterium]